MQHQFYTNEHYDVPDAIKDRNGDVVLGLCRACGQGEADLEPNCPAFGIASWRTEREAYGGEYADYKHADDEIQLLRALLTQLTSVKPVGRVVERSNPSAATEWLRRPYNLVTGMTDILNLPPGTDLYANYPPVQGVDQRQFTVVGSDPRVNPGLDSYVYAVKCARSHIGPCRPDRDEPEDQWYWDKLTGLLGLMNGESENAR